MTSSAPAVIKPNSDRGGKRLDAYLEAFAVAVRGVTHGVRRGYVYYQTCRGAKTSRCGAHELVMCPPPAMWHCVETVTRGVTTWEPEYAASRDFAAATNLPVGVVGSDLIRVERDSDTRSFDSFHTATGGAVGVSVWDGCMWTGVPLPDFWQVMWDVHVKHVRDSGCQAPLTDSTHREARSELLNKLSEGTARVNNSLRVVYGVAHTDTDLLLVDPSGAPLLVVEEYRPYINPKTGREDKKHISFSKSLSAQAGGGLVVLMRSDGHPGGPLVEEVWDMRPHPRFRGGEQLVGISHGVRGYPALLDFIRDSSVFAPYLR